MADCSVQVCYNKLMPAHGVMRRDRKNHSNLRPKHKHTKNYLQHYWPYLPMVTLVLVGLWLIRPASMRSNHRGVLAFSTNVSSPSLLNETNEVRTQNAQKTLKTNEKLASAAQSKAQDMVNRNYWAHNTPEGSPPWTFIVNAGYQYQKAGENLAYGFADSKDTVAGWMNSPSHRRNVLDPDFTDVGFGSANSDNFNNSGPATVVVAMYGRAVTDTPIVQVVGSDNSETPEAFNSLQKSAPTEVKKVSRIQAILSGKLPWISSAVSFAMGAALAAFIFEHSLSVKKALKHGERYVVTHPMLDVLLVSIIVVGLVITGQAGVIL